MSFEKERSLSYLPREIHDLFSSEAAYLREQLILNRLTVVTKIAPEPKHYNHKIRIVISENPEWYKTIWAERGRMHRYLALPSLQRIAQERDRNFEPNNYRHNYDSIFRQLIFERLTKGCNDLRDYLHPSSEVCNYFNLAWKAEGEIIKTEIIFPREILY